MRPLPSGAPRAALVAVLAATVPGALAAQATTAVIAGVVRAAGAPVPGATVIVRNEATGFTVRRVTGADGRYAAAQLPLGGPYTVSARRLGFQPVAQRGVTLRLGDRFPADFALEAAAQRVGEAVQALGIGITGMAESGVLLGSDGTVQAPIMAWFDARGADQMRALPTALLDSFSARTGLPTTSQWSLAKLLWLRGRGIRVRPGMCWLNVPEYVAVRLGADRATEPSLNTSLRSSAGSCLPGLSET